MKIVKADLIQIPLFSEADVILHGCNCFCTMGAGLAKQIKGFYPEAYAVDQKTIKGDKKKLGSISYAKIIRSSAKTPLYKKVGNKNVLQHPDVNFYVVNCYTQYKYWGKPGEVHADYEAIRECLKNVREKFSDEVIAYPKIGAGLANGDWSIISEIIEEEFKDLKHFLVIQ